MRFQRLNHSFARCLTGIQTLTRKHCFLTVANLRFEWLLIRMNVRLIIDDQVCCWPLIINTELQQWCLAGVCVTFTSFVILHPGQQVLVEATSRLQFSFCSLVFFLWMVLVAGFGLTRGPGWRPRFLLLFPPQALRTKEQMATRWDSKWIVSDWPHKPRKQRWAGQGRGNVKAEKNHEF